LIGVEHISDTWIRQFRQSQVLGRYFGIEFGFVLNSRLDLTTVKSYFPISLQDDVLGLIDPKLDGQARSRALDTKSLPAVNVIFSGNSGIDNHAEQVKAAKRIREQQRWYDNRTAVRKLGQSRKSSIDAQMLNSGGCGNSRDLDQLPVCPEHPGFDAARFVRIDP
jgi:hypothetical protein